METRRDPCIGAPHQFVAGLLHGVRVERVRYLVHFLRHYYRILLHSPSLLHIALHVREAEGNTGWTSMNSSTFLWLRLHGAVRAGSG